MSDERLRVHRPALTREGAIFEGGDRALVDPGLSIRREIAETGAVRLAVALRHEAVRRLQEPEGGPHAVRGARHPKEPAHALHTIVTGQPTGAGRGASSLRRERSSSPRRAPIRES